MLVREGGRYKLIACAAALPSHANASSTGENENLGQKLA
jgi:hypothetical protein